MDRLGTKEPMQQALATSYLTVAVGLMGLVTACVPPVPPSLPHTRPTGGPTSISAAEIADIFRAHGVSGCFVLHNVRRSTTVRYNPTRTGRRMVPASTFKIPNALIGVETGVIQHGKQLFKWRGKKYWVAAWNRDHTLHSAIRFSVVWAFQRIARQVGRARLQHWVNRLAYGNRDLSGPIDKFWLDGRLRISAEEQVAFLKRFQAGTLPFSKRTQTLVREALVVERTSTYVLRAKTGWAIGKKREHGWYVGWVERGTQVWIFAMNMDGHWRKDHKARIAISRDVLRRAGALGAR